MSAPIGIVNISSGKFFVKDASGDLVQLQQGDIVTIGMTIVGDKGNSTSNSMVIKTSTGVELVVSGTQEQNFDESTIAKADAFDGVLAAENVELALAESEKAEKEKDEAEEEKGEEEEEAQKEEEQEASIAERGGQLVDIKTTLKQEGLSPEGKKSLIEEDDSEAIQKNTDSQNMLAERNNPLVDVTSNLGSHDFGSTASITTATKIPQDVFSTTASNDRSVDEDNAPVFGDTPNNELDPVTGEYTFEYAENAADGDILGTVNASDLDGDTVTYSITANENGYYEIDAAGNISLTAAGVTAYANDFELGDNAQVITVEATDGTNATTITVNLMRQILMMSHQSLILKTMELLIHSDMMKTLQLMPFLELYTQVMLIVQQ